MFCTIEQDKTKKTLHIPKPATRIIVTGLAIFLSTLSSAGQDTLSSLPKLNLRIGPDPLFAIFTPYGSASAGIEYRFSNRTSFGSDYGCFYRSPLFRKEPKQTGYFVHPFIRTYFKTRNIFFCQLEYQHWNGHRTTQTTFTSDSVTWNKAVKAQNATQTLLPSIGWRSSPHRHIALEAMLGIGFRRSNNKFTNLTGKETILIRTEQASLSSFIEQGISRDAILAISFQIAIPLSK